MPPRSVKAQNPQLAALLARPALDPGELALRLYYMYALHQAEPVWDSFGAAGADAGDAQPVPKGLWAQLVAAHPYACFSYDLCDDPALGEALAGKGGWAAQYAAGGIWDAWAGRRARCQS